MITFDLEFSENDCVQHVEFSILQENLAERIQSILTANPNGRLIVHLRKE